MFFLSDGPIVPPSFVSLVYFHFLFISSLSEMGSRGEGEKNSFSFCEVALLVLKSFGAKKEGKQS